MVVLVCQSQEVIAHAQAEGRFRIKSMAVKQLHDCEGLTVTCTNEDALPVYNEMLLVLIPARKNALSLVQSVLELDPGFVLAHCALVGFIA